MRPLIKFNGSREAGFPQYPGLFDDFLTRDFFNWPVKNQHNLNTMPAVNIKESDSAYELEIAAPGMEKKDFKVKVENNTLTISAERENKVEEKNEEGKYTRREFSFQSFKRSFMLPENQVQDDNISATYKDGILLVSIPKKEEAKAKPVKEIEIA